MSNFQPTHRTKPGVEVRIYGDTEDQADLQIGMIHYAIIPELIALLFEPIPKPVKMIEIPLGVAQVIRDTLKRMDVFDVSLDVAIRAAEQQRKVFTTTECTRSAKP
jgi:hypothetical protein